MNPDHGEDTRASLMDGDALVGRIRSWGAELGFAAIGISGVEVGEASRRLRVWLDQGCHGTMDYMARHATLEPNRSGCWRVLCA